MSALTALSTSLRTVVAVCERFVPQMAAAAPATWGEAIDVPLMVLVPLPSHVDTMPWPGAKRSMHDP
ncbi:unannotated protein [freshwater metagenome]|uniref:Unannotated protein n=1 Tax=freshwater metagenome TaxID=449393 RepID=A0A6J6EX25_9ZZZZ